MDSAMTPPHVMVIGGTGMLADLCQILADRGHPVSVLARQTRELGSGVGVFTCDYTRPGELDEAIWQAIESLGPVRTLISWIHSTAPDAPAHAQRLANPDRHLRILGSTSAKQPAPGLAEAGWERITLGWVRTGSTSRWLTHAEICRGVLEAFDHSQPVTVVGTLEPGAHRPR